MQLYEWEAKQLVAQHAIAVPRGHLVRTPAEARVVAGELGAPRLFVKAQVLAAERQKAGGIRDVETAEDAARVAAHLLGTALGAPSQGLVADGVLIEEAVATARELYLALLIDPVAGALVLTMAGAAVAGAPIRPERVVLGLDDVPSAEVVAAALRVGLDAEAAARLAAFVVRLRNAFVALDATAIEINPLALTVAGDLVALDVKLAFDDNALYRHPEIAELSRQRQQDPIMLRAQSHQMNFVPMDGDIGTVANGAGLGLATLDMIRAAGGSPANFMDIRTTARSLDIAKGISLLLERPKLKVLLVNVFGGGMQPCDTIVDGVGIAFRRAQRTVPIVARIIGHDDLVARSRLKNFGLPVTECPHMWDAVSCAVSIAKGSSHKGSGHGHTH